MELKSLKEILKPNGWKIAFFLLMAIMIPPLVTVSLTLEFFSRVMVLKLTPETLSVGLRLLIFYILIYTVSSLIVYFQETGREKILWIVFGISTISLVLLIIFSFVFGI